MRSLISTLILALCLPTISEARKRPSRRSLEDRVKRLEAALAHQAPDISSLRLPKKIEFCGVPVPLDIEDVRERMEREFYLMMDNRAQVVLWVKRARRAFPHIDAVTRAEGVCADLKYLAVIESGLRPAVVSRSKARGWWQFMAGTGRQYGLHIDDLWDERADLEGATEAGIKYLARLKGKFGSWPMAMAAYNTGPGRLSKAVEAQGQTDYWRLDLLREAERYVPRIILAKLIFERLDEYGFHVDIEDGYPPEPVGYVKIKARSDGQLDLLAAAKGTGISYRTLKRLNRRISTDDIPGGRAVVIRVPQGSERAFRAWARQALGLPAADGDEDAPRAHASPAIRKDGKAQARGSAARKRARRARPTEKRSKEKAHTVRPGESLWGIAKKYDVTIEDLRRWNQLKNTDVLTPGQRLVVAR